MLGVSARWLPAVLSVLALAGGNAFAARSGSNSPASTSMQPVAQSTGHSGSIGSGAGAMALCSSHLSYAHDVVRGNNGQSPSQWSLGVAGMLLTGCRFLWLVAVACLLSYGQYWQTALARLRCLHHDYERTGPSLLTVAPVTDSQIPSCMNVCQQAMRKVDGQRNVNAAKALAIIALASDSLESRPAPALSPPLPSLSRLEFAQLGRGPPPVF